MSFSTVSHIWELRLRKAAKLWACTFFTRIISVAAVIAVVRTNKPALALYEKLGFVKLGVIPKGFLMKDGIYEDIIPHYIEL